MNANLCNNICNCNCMDSIQCNVINNNNTNINNNNNLAVENGTHNDDGMYYCHSNCNVMNNN